MTRRPLRAAGSSFLAVSAVVGLAACGSSAPKISSSDFITKCTSNKEITTAIKQLPGGTSKLDSLCHCVQSRLVAKGFGDRTTDDNGTDIKNAGRDAGIACAEKILAGG